MNVESEKPGRENEFLPDSELTTVESPQGAAMVSVMLG
jgi:hypothetical protein